MSFVHHSPLSSNALYAYLLENPYNSEEHNASIFRFRRMSQTRLQQKQIQPSACFCWLLGFLIYRSWRCKRYFPPKYEYCPFPYVELYTNELYLFLQPWDTQVLHEDLPSLSSRQLLFFSRVTITLWPLAWFVEAMCYKPEGHGFNSRLGLYFVFQFA
jgi:hypothetical protein